MSSTRPDAPVDLVPAASRRIDAGDLAGAAELCQQALGRNSEDPGALHLLGLIANLRGHSREAARLMRLSLALDSSVAQFHNNLGEVWRNDGDLERAIECYDHAIRLQPKFAEAFHNRALARRFQGRIDLAIEDESRAVQLMPDSADLQFNLGLFLLLAGRLSEGFAQLEWRWKAGSHRSPRPDFAQPRWDGADLTGKTLLLFSEQGYGDTLQLIRFAPLLAQRGARVLVQCQGKEVAALVAGVDGVTAVYVRGEPLPSFDLFVPMMDLPMHLGTSLETIPAQPYLHADPQLIARWRQRLPETPSQRKVGLVWAGRPTHDNDRNRSLLLQDLAPLGGLPDVALFSLQVGLGSQQVARPPVDLNLTDLGPELRDFSDTAALLENLDLLICVDTAIAHLAGALGRPVWLLTPFVGDWRWMQKGARSPWYPTMRIFRQQHLGQWRPIVEQVRLALMAPAKAPA